MFDVSRLSNDYSSARVAGPRATLAAQINAWVKHRENEYFLFNDDE